MPKTGTPQAGLFDTPRPGTNSPEFTVAEISRLVKKTVEDTFGQVRVKGEISECKFHSNGHVYITLKDETAVLAAVCWRGQAGKLGIKPETGMEVVCTGRLTTYMGQSKYQLVIESMALAGMGALLKLLEDRKKKLAAEGLFDAARKQLLPFLPDVIGVVTSPTGAVIRDIIHRLADRFPRRVLVWPVAVQGEGAAAQIAFAIDGFNNLPEKGAIPRPDVLIIARGGGSVEDLMPFNEEIVVRAAAASNIPLISAVGHETDTTLIDLASDVRAPTPTAAAEMAVPVRLDLLAQVMDDGRRLSDCLRRMLSAWRERIGLLNRALGDPTRVIEPLVQKLDEKTDRLALAKTSFMQRCQSRLSEAGGKLRHPRDLLALAKQKLNEHAERLGLSFAGFLDRQNSRLKETYGKMRHPRDRLPLANQQLAHLAHRAESGWGKYFLRKQHQLAALGPALHHLSPRNVLGRGYALVQNAAGHIVSSRAQLKRGDSVRIEFQDGARKAAIEDE